MSSAPGEWWFYHIDQTSVPEAVAPLVEKCLERGWRVVIAGGEETLAVLDRHLWTWRDDSFLPHGRDGSEAARQPVLLSREARPVNGARAAILLDGTTAEVGAFERAIVVFDGGDSEVRGAARRQYRLASEQGARVRYFQQDAAGGWREKA
jgi:DNA polymerase-3 subunit chi